MRVALYGGSFDPVHEGHADIIAKLCDRFDEVIVMPTALSPFKLHGGAVSAEHRLNMLKSCCFGQNVVISDYEVGKGGVSYTADTLRYLSDTYDDITVVMGSEELPNLDKWKESDFLQKFRYYIIHRPGFDFGAISLPRAFRYEVADFEGKSVSSAMIKVDIAFGKKPAVPSKVADYIEQNGLYGEWKAYTDKYTEFNMKPSRIDHTYRAIKAGVELAKRFKVDMSKVILALILHDIGKFCNKDFLLQKGIITPEFIENLPEPLRHAHYSESIARQYFCITDEVILEAIRAHTTCDEDMSDCAKIVALADYIEEGRSFEGVDEVRRLAKISLDGAVVRMLEITLAYLKSEGQTIGDESVKALEFYKKNCL